MFFANFVTPVFRENAPDNSLQKKVSVLKRKVRVAQEKLTKIRQKNSDYQVEIFQINKQLKNPVRDEMEEKAKTLETKLKNVDLQINNSEKLIETYDKIISKFGANTKTKNTSPRKKNFIRPISQLNKNKYLTPLERAQNTHRALTSLKNKKRTLPPLTIVDDNRKIVQRMESKFGTSNPYEILAVIDNLRSLRENLKKKIDLMVIIENAYEKKKERLKYKGTKKGELMEKLRETRIKVYDTKIAVLDMKETNGALQEKISNLYNALATERKSFDTLSSLRWVADYAISQLTEVSSRKEEIEQESERTTTVRFEAIPKLPIGSTMIAPLTRISRKINSAMSTMRRAEDAGEMDKEMTVFGETLGHIFVDRFSSAFMSFNTPVSKEKIEEPEYPEPSQEAEEAASQGEIETILARLFVEYSATKESLGYSMLTDNEIYKTNPSFFSFLSSRDALISAVNDMFNMRSIIDFIKDKFKEDSTVACWMMRDMILFTQANEFLNEIVNTVEEFYNEDVEKFSSDLYMQMAWAALFSAIFEYAENVNLHLRLSSIVANNFMIEPNIVFESEMTKFHVLILLDLARHVPDRYLTVASVQGQLSSFLLRFMSLFSEYETCFQTGALFFSYCFQLLDEESVMWHFALFFHTLIKSLASQEIRESIIVSCITALRAVVEQRHKWNYEQIKALFLLNNMLKHIELEAYPNGRVFRHKAVPANPTVSIKDIPSLSLNAVIPSLNFDNPKLQLHFQPKAAESEEEKKKDKEEDNENEYLSKKRFYPIYASDTAHVHMIELIFSLVIDHKLHKFDIKFVDQFPHVNRKPNVLYPIMKHMENKYNSYLMEDFSDEFRQPPSLGEPDSARAESFRSLNVGAQSLGLLSTLVTNDEHKDANDVPSIHLKETNVITNEISNVILFMRKNIIHHKGDYQRMLRLTMPALFKPKTYSNGKHIASGAFGVVMKIPPKEEGGVTCAVKILQKSTNEFDNPHLFEVFTEVSILDLCRGDRRVTQLIDFGCTVSSYYIVMEYYPTTLKAWRKSFTENPPLETMLRVYREFLNAGTVLVDRRINHFDIKCDNVMLDRNGIPALSDFGESMCYKDERNCYTLLNKGTEWIKSPEMLSIALTSTTTSPNFDRRKKIGAGPESDIWSIGCLFFELLTGHFLFATTDWSFFYTRVTSEGPVLEEKDRKELNDLGCKNGEAFLEFVLKRSVITRPNLEQIIVKFDELFPEAKEAPLPQIT